MAQLVNNLPAMQVTWVQSLGWEDPLEEGMATHSSILAWRILWTEEPGGLQSTGLQRAINTFASLHQMPPPTLRAPLPPALSLFLLLFNLFCHVLSHFSHVQLFSTPWTAACQTPLTMKYSRQEYWSGEPFPSPGDLPNPGIKIGRAHV